MRIAVAAVIALVVAPAGAMGQQPGEVLTPKGGRFSVRFPGKPKETSQTTKTPIGELKVYSATYATADGNVYLVSHTEFPDEAIRPETHPTMLDGVRTGLAGKDGKVVSENRDITVGSDKVPGREIVVDKGKQQTRFRVAIRGDRLYQVGAVGTGEFVTGPDVTAFLDSFQFTK